MVVENPAKNQVILNCSLAPFTGKFFSQIQIRHLFVNKKIFPSTINIRNLGRNYFFQKQS